MNPLTELNDHGQVVWMDFIRRDLLTGGELQRLVEIDGLTGVTSNPAIFEKAIGGSTEYDDQIARLLESGEPTVMDLYEAIVFEDIRLAADILRPVYDGSDRADGYVSLEVSPHLANDTQGTVEQALDLWRRVDRPNLMIKVPATAEGIPAIEELLAGGVNVNVTLMFSLADYEAVAQAYLRGLARLDDPAPVASVASFFVSRVDSKVDALLEANGSEAALELQGAIAVANSKLAYRRYQEIFLGDAFAELRQRGARVQRVLWASTSTKDPAYRDVLYVEELIGPQTVNTLPPATIEAFRDHGRVRTSLTENVDLAERQIASLADFGIDFDAVTADLQREGVEKFVQPFDQLLETLDRKRLELAAGAGS
jgi:transaldolase/transaldolase/glucose-6-phosphate isomerase